MKRVMKFTIAPLIIISISGCCEKGMQYANNGQAYYVDTCSCPGYRIIGNTVHCIDKNGNYTGVTYQPLSNGQVQNMLYQERTNQQTINSVNRNLQMQQQNFQLQQQTNQLQRINTYLRYGY